MVKLKKERAKRKQEIVTKNHRSFQTFKDILHFGNSALPTDRWGNVYRKDAQTYILNKRRDILYIYI